jgi:hypothetical protein
MSLRSIYREDNDWVGQLNFFCLQAAFSHDPGMRGTLRVGMCECTDAQNANDIRPTYTTEVHCHFCERVVKTIPLMSMSKRGVWIDRDSGKRYTVVTHDTTGPEEEASPPARSQIPRW